MCDGMCSGVWTREAVVRGADSMGLHTTLLPQTLLAFWTPSQSDRQTDSATHSPYPNRHPYSVSLSHTNTFPTTIHHKLPSVSASRHPTRQTYPFNVQQKLAKRSNIFQTIQIPGQSRARRPKRPVALPMVSSHHVLCRLPTMQHA